MSAQKITTDEVIDSLTGFDEEAIEKQFGAPWQTLAAGRSTAFLRAMIFATRRQAGVADLDARQQVMEMTLRECQNLFGEEDEELDPDEPDTPAGKDASGPASRPRSWPPSVS